MSAHDETSKVTSSSDCWKVLVVNENEVERIGEMKGRTSNPGGGTVNANPPNAIAKSETNSTNREVYVGLVG